MEEGTIQEAYEALVANPELAPVLDMLDVMQQSVDQVNTGLEQLHVDSSLIFLAVVLLVGVILGCAISFMLVKLWGS